MNLETLLDQPQALPSAPGIVKDLIASFEDEGIPLEEIARKISADQVLTAKLLRLANSAHYHVARTIGTVNQGITILGFNAVRTLVISTGLTGSFKQIPGFELAYFWRYSLHTAVCAKWLAKKYRQNPEMAFTIGLMHAIGQLVMHAGMPEACQRVDQMTDVWGDRRLQIESEQFGYNFANVSAELAKRWGFPQEFVVAINAYPSPINNPMAALIHIASWFARAQKNGLTVEEMEAGFPLEIGRELGFSFEEINEEMPTLDELSEGLDVLISG